MSQVHPGQSTQFVILLEARKRLESVRPYAHSLTRRPQGHPEELLDASHTSTRGAPDVGFCGSWSPSWMICTIHFGRFLHLRDSPVVVNGGLRGSIQSVWPCSVPRWSLVRTRSLLSILSQGLPCGLPRATVRCLVPFDPGINP